MKRLILIVCLINFTLSQAYADLKQVVALVDDLNNSAHNLGRIFPPDCSAGNFMQNLISENISSEYSCKYEPKIKIPPGERLFALMPKDHPFAKKYKTRLISIGVNASSMNDNAWQMKPFLNYGIIKNKYLRGDDRGATFGIDYGGDIVLQISEKNKIKIAFNKRLRQITQGISGSTHFNQQNENFNVYVYDDIDRVRLSNSIISRNFDYNGGESLDNQRSLTAEYLELDLVLDQPQLDYGLELGIKKLDDTPEQMGARIQDNWHQYRDITRYNWEDFSNLIIDGVYNYFTITPKISFDAPELQLFNGVCTINSNVSAGAKLNIPMEKESFKLNPIQPFISNKVSLGVIPTKKYHTGKSRFELEIETLIDPLNQTPLNVDPGAIGSVSAGLVYNQPIGARTILSVIPIRMHFPIYGKNENNSLISDNVINLNGRDIKTQQSEREFTTDVITIKLNQRIEPFPKN